MKHPVKTRINIIATRVYDWDIPGITWLADWVRDWSLNEDLYYD